MIELFVNNQDLRVAVLKDVGKYTKVLQHVSSEVNVSLSLPSNVSRSGALERLHHFFLS